MKKLLPFLASESGVIHSLPLLIIVAAVGIISYLLISSTAPFKAGLFGIINPRAASNAATGPIIDMAFPCGFTNPAFCDNFSEGPAQAPNRGRGNDLDLRKWSFNRIDGGGANLGQGAFLGWGAVGQIEHCKTTEFNVLAPNDSFFCGNEVPEPEHWMEATDAQGGYRYNDARIRQPFDFTGRTGFIQYGVDAKNTGTHGWWLETWITDEPIPGPDSQLNGGTPAANNFTPRNGIGISFVNNCRGVSNPPDFATHGGAGTMVSDIFSINNFNYNNVTPELSIFNNAPCILTQDDVSNMIQIKVSTTRVEIWGSDAGSNVLKLMNAANFNPPLPFSVGYVHFIHVVYNPEKCGAECTQFSTYHWHDMGFDGPVHPAPKAYEAPDANARGGRDIGYWVHPDGTISDVDGKSKTAFTFNNVDTTGATRANINFTALGFTRGSNIFYQLNNSPQRTFTFPTTATGVEQLGASIPIQVSDLQNGTNNLKLKTDSTWFQAANSMIVANLELEVNPTDSATPANAAGMIPCSMMNLMMGVMPGMVMSSNDPCMGPMPSPSPIQPKITILSPVNGSVLPASTGVTLQYIPNMNVPAIGATHAHWQIDGGAVQMDSAYTGGYQFNNVGPGSHTISGFLVDSSMNKIAGSDATTTFTLQTPPTPTPTPTPSSSCPKGVQGDIDCDGSIGIFDFNILVGNFGKSVPVNTQGDLDGDGNIGIFDFNILVGNFGK